MRQAFRELVGDGLVYRVPGRGTFALTPPRDGKYLRSLGSIEDLMSLAVDTELEVIEPFRTAVDVSSAARMRLRTDEVAWAVCRRLNRDEPFCLTTFYLPPALGDLVASDPRIATAGARSKVTIIGLLEEAIAVPLIAGATQSITASIADARTAELIGCSTGDPVLSVDRMYIDPDGRPVELAVSSFNVRRYSYRLEVRRTAS